MIDMTEVNLRDGGEQVGEAGDLVTETATTQG